MTNSVDIKITGIVQGVGFRPFVCKLSNKYDIKGWVLNESSGVFIHAEGLDDNLNNFINEIKNNPPPLAVINDFTCSNAEALNFKDFTIKESHKTEDPFVFISPDVCTCNDCRQEVLDSDNKRYFYPFTNCTNCGPRFSIIKEVPYDRKFTTMNPFVQCNDCLEEYTDIENRRFHAQPNCCPKCGPSISILDSHGNDLTNEIVENSSFNSVEYNKKLISFFQNSIVQGRIWAVKGISGFHLCCSPYEEEIVKLLRDRKHRPTKPLALMMKDIETVKKYCIVSSVEEKMILDKSRPIVLLQKRNNDYFPGNISPNNNLIGVMLPSTPLQILMMENSPFDSLIMTSGNLSGLPLEYENESSIKNLATFVDYFLTNNREIVLPLDDSIMTEVLGEPCFIRRSRGYVPTPFNYKDCDEILALGGDMKNTFSISKRAFIYVGPHNGDLDNYEVIQRLQENIKRYIKMFELSPKAIVCDLHPSFESSRLTNDFSLPIIKVQHHHAHIVSCMVENNINKKVIGIAFDGTGYGDDDCIWGSEFLICDLKEYTRVGHLDYVDFLGGDSTLRDGDKLALSYLHKLAHREDVKNIVQKYYNGNFEIVFKLLKHSKFSYKSSSMGRLFDGVSSLLNICHHSSYEGEAASILETILPSNDMIEGYPINIIKKYSVYTLSPVDIIDCILTDINDGISKEVISHKFHSTIINYIVKMCEILRTESSLDTVSLSGGVFQNKFLISNAYKELTKRNFNVIFNKKIPTNDGGISVGQLVIAKELKASER